MKKVVILLLAFTLIFCATSVSAYAAGKITEQQENFWVINSYSTYAYSYAKVKNVGDKPIKVNAGILEIFDENGDVITSTDYLHSYAEYLQPDEYTYVYLYDQIDNPNEVTVDDYLLTLTGKSDQDEISLRLPCTTEYKPDETQGYWTYDYMYATITNDTDEPLYDIRVVFALLDDDDNILYMSSDSIGSNVALMPGTSIIVRSHVDSDFVENYTAKGYNATKVDAIAYSNIDAF